MKEIDLELCIYEDFYPGDKKCNELVAKKILSRIIDCKEIEFETKDTDNNKGIKRPDLYCNKNEEYYEIRNSDDKKFIEKFNNDNCKKDFKGYSEEDFKKLIINAIESKIKKDYCVPYNLFIFSTILCPTYLLGLQHLGKEINGIYDENNGIIKNKIIPETNKFLFSSLYRFCNQIKDNYINNKLKNIFIIMFMPNMKVMIISVNDLDNGNFIRTLETKENSIVPYYKIIDINDNLNSQKNIFNIVIKKLKKI